MHQGTEQSLIYYNFTINHLQVKIIIIIIIIIIIMIIITIIILIKKRAKRARRTRWWGEVCERSETSNKKRDTVDIFEKVDLLGSSPCYRLVTNSSTP